MTLPKLNDTPKYETVVPSTGVKVKFRPYLVKEEKVLLLAMESQDQAQALQAIVDTIGACVTGDINISKLTTFDVEFLFLKIRSKSVGEKSNLVIGCKECKHENAVSLNLDEVKIDVKGAPDGSIKLTDKITLKMRWPSYQSVTTSQAVTQARTATEQAFAVVAKCIESIQTETENILAKDVTEKELIDFLESMTSDQYKKLVEYVGAMPKLQHHLKFNCEKCFAPNEITLEGIKDFF
jgi:hypothetical protein